MMTKPLTVSAASFESDFPTPPNNDRSYSALRGWAARIRAWEGGLHGTPSPRDAWTVFLADRIADGELMELCGPYPVIAERIIDRIKLCSRHYDKLERDPDNADAPFDLAYAMSLLRQRIEKAIEIVDHAAALAAKLDEKPTLNKRQAEVLEIIRNHQPIREEGIREHLSMIVGANTIRRQDIPTLKEHYGVISTGNGYVIAS